MQELLCCLPTVRKKYKNDELIVPLNTLNPNRRYRLTHTARDVATAHF